MWTKTAENNLKEIGLTEKQIDVISDKSMVGVGIITNVLLEAIKLGIIVINNEIHLKTYSVDEVKSIVQMIYSEFAESPLNQHTTQQLRKIIELEVEQHPIKPIKIFK